MTFSAATYKGVFEAADQVYLSSQQVQVAAVATPRPLDETLPAFASQNQPQVAAVSTKKPKKNKNKNNKPDKPRKKHASVPDSLADKLCGRHYSRRRSKFNWRVRIRNDAVKQLSFHYK